MSRLSSFGRPWRLPVARALAMPARTRSEMSERSNSAIVEIRVNTALPIGEEVDLLGYRDEVHAQVLECFQSIDELLRRAREAVELPHQNGVDLTGVHRLPEALKSWSVSGGAAHLVDKLGGDRQLAMGGVGAQLAQLHGRILIQRRDMGVDGGSEW